MIHTICKKDYPKGTFDEFGTVVCDEVQHLGSEMFSQALPKIACRYTLGLSATPNRNRCDSVMSFISTLDLCAILNGEVGLIVCSLSD